MMAINIPFIILGKIKTGSGYKESFKFRDRDVEVVMPELSLKDVQDIRDNIRSGHHDLHKLSSQDIISFLLKVKERWNSREKKSEVMRALVEMTGYSFETIELSMQQINQMLSREYLEGLLEYELGNKQIMDDWIKKGEFHLHAQPRGTVLHILAGNVPVISVLSLVRGLLTKNVNIFKIPSRDLVTMPYMLKVFNEVDADHPITKSVSAVFWPNSNNEILENFIEMSNAICVWGDQEAISSVRSRPHVNREVISFGPRRGIHLLGREVHTSREINEIARRAAHDLTVFDQEGCFSPQVAFVEGSREHAVKYADALGDALDIETKKFPKGKMTLQQTASITHARAYSSFLGHHVVHKNNFEYTILVVNSMENTKSHPLGRTLFVVPVNDLKEVAEHIGHETQVVAVEPFERAKELRDELTMKGVDRITHLGKMAYFANGAPHEGIYPLSRLVRWVKSR